MRASSPSNFFQMAVKRGLPSLWMVTPSCRGRKPFPLRSVNAATNWSVVTYRRADHVDGKPCWNEPDASTWFPKRWVLTVLRALPMPV